ncbi:pyridoxamine 5'-phosphate oxidase family protein [Xylophilus sp.]|uniref:pyridoxamine 5'-phosphate oxidase family protein n=1 Tax=Xylophilus sp. TaxID=2653893 RepID=UPI0013BDEE7C|nr:pyridoxamine 5'-phosphate oxidase family protein [Xylophilus sp.]KAF1047527.1 MAG: hypothetical protein GAK38_01878 [Xylophilus sp.]
MTRGAPGPFHAGEVAAQRRAGTHAVAQRMAGMVRDAMPPQHQDFFAQLPFVVLAARDGGGQPWATLRCGAPGFVRACDARTLAIAAPAVPHEPIAPADLAPGAQAGLLGIELPTRRRNRANGRVLASGAGRLVLGVEQSFGNCPKYIAARLPVPRPAPAGDAPPDDMHGGLDEPARALVRGADTFFIASAAPHGVDASHRGGAPGFARVEEAGRLLVVPDYAGNGLFNTLGNLLVDPRAGLLFIDFAGGGLLYVAAQAEIGWEAGAQRQLRLRVARARRVPGGWPFTSGPAQPSPFLARNTPPIECP